MLNSFGRNEPPLWTVIGNPRSRRVAGFQEAVERQGGGRVRILPYLDVIGEACPEPPPPGTIVRIESPAEDLEVSRKLLRSGIVPMGLARRIPVESAAIDSLEWGRGEIIHPRQWFLGFSSVLGRLDNAWSGSGVRWMSSPASVVAAFDKLVCLKRWAAAGLPVPYRWDGIQTYAQLRAAIPDRHARLFVKLRYGYSAMGAVALEWRGDRVRAITAVETVWSNGRPRLFVTKRPRVLDREFEIAWLIDTLAMEEILVEVWLPKARWKGRPFDLRIVTIGGRPRHVVGRASNSPFTNLNLDAVRLSREEVLSNLGDSWSEVERFASAAAAELPDAFMLGIDLLVRPRCRKFALLEANAFGDYLPKLLDRGQSTYAAEVETFLRTQLHCGYPGP